MLIAALQYVLDNKSTTMFRFFVIIGTFSRVKCSNHKCIICILMINCYYI